MKITLAILLLFFCSTSFALVNMKNANYSHAWIDYETSSSGFSLNLERTYNSRSLYNGMFGFGWCTDYENKIKQTPEGNIKLINCGGGSEIEFYSSSRSAQFYKKTIKKIVQNLKKDGKLSDTNIRKISAQMEVDVWMRERYAKKFKIKRALKKGQYLAFGKNTDRIEFLGNSFKRFLPTGGYESYDIKGRLVSKYDKNNNFIKLVYTGKKLSKITDQDGNAILFKYDGSNGKVVLAITPQNGKLVFKYNGEDLVYVKNFWKNVYRYKYDQLHNLTVATYPDKTTKEITYDPNKDWVLTYKDRNNCLEKYNYNQNKKDPLNRYTSAVTKSCGGKVVNSSSFQFIHKKSSNGTRFLSRTVEKVNGVLTQTDFHPLFGKPIQIKNGNKITKFEYYKSGELKRKAEPKKISNYFYKNKCNKVSKITDKIFGVNEGRSSASKGNVKKLLKTVNTTFKYSFPGCNLDLAVNSTGQKIKLKYDKNGRIISLVDQARKAVNIVYDSRIGKPKKITRPGVGSILVSYDPAGNIKKVKSKQGPDVAGQVAGVFTNLLQVISPATSQLGI